MTKKKTTKGSAKQKPSVSKTKKGKISIKNKKPIKSKVESSDSELDVISGSDSD